MGNSGAHKDAAGAERVFARNFADYDYIVGPSASCTHHVREHFTAIEQTREVQKVRQSTYELVEFLHDVLKVREFPWAEFPHRVGLHNSCSAVRHLRETSNSEVAVTPYSKPRALLEGVKASNLCRPRGPTNAAASAARFPLPRKPYRCAWDRTRCAITSARGRGEYIVSGDMSCLMHQQRCAERMKMEVRFIHIAQVLNGARG